MKVKRIIYLLIGTMTFLGCIDTTNVTDLQVSSSSFEKVVIEPQSSSDKLESSSAKDSVFIPSEQQILSSSMDTSAQNFSSSSIAEPDFSSSNDMTWSSSKDVQSLYGEFEIGHTYEAGDIVMFENELYRCMSGLSVPWCSVEAYQPGGDYWEYAWEKLSESNLKSSSLEISSSGEKQILSSSSSMSSSSSLSSSSQKRINTSIWSDWTKRINKKSMIGYYASWQWYDRNKLIAPQNIDFSKWTRINFAFFHPDVDGFLHMTDEWGDPQVLFGEINWNPQPNDKEICYSKLPVHSAKDKSQILRDCNYFNLEDGLIERTHAAGTELWPSIGGWTLSNNFSDIAANPQKRKNFAGECVRILRDYNFDGIDIDWEYPAYVSHEGKPEDKENFLLLLKEVKDSIAQYGASLAEPRSIGYSTTSSSKKYGLTAALPCGTSIIENGIDVPVLTSLLTEFNLMTYDFNGAFNPTVDHNSPLFYNGLHVNKRFTVDGCVAEYLERGVLTEQINIGSGFYGRSFAGATELGGNHQGNDVTNWPEDEGMPNYYNIMKKYQAGGWTRKWDDKAKVPYLVKNGGSIVSYEDEESIKIKADYLLDNSLSGVIVWEISGDFMEDKATPLTDVFYERLNK